MSDEQMKSAKPLTSGLESLLRLVDLHEAVIMCSTIRCSFHWTQQKKTFERLAKMLPAEILPKDSVTSVN